jgi:hypothetical protein
MATRHRHYYGASTMDVVVRRFEELHGMSTDEFLAQYAVHDPVPGISGFHCHVWASFAADRERLSGSVGFRLQAERLLEHA